MSRAQKPLVIAFALLIAALVATIVLFDWNMLRGFVERQVTERTGRSFSLGHLNVDISLNPRIYLKDVKLANAPWGKEPLMLDIGAAEFTVSIRKLLSSEVVLSDVVLTKPKTVLEVNPNGERNWVFNDDRKRGKPPTIQRLRIDEGALSFRAPQIATDISAAINTASATTNAERRMQFQAEGKFKGMPVNAKGYSGSLLSLQDKGAPYPIQATVRIGDTHADVDGVISDLASFSALDVKFKLRDQDMSKLYPLIGVVLPSTPPYAINGRLSRQGDVWSLTGFTGKMGDSDLSGDLRINVAGPRPKLTGEVRSRALDIDDLAGVIGAPPATGAGETASPPQKKLAAKQAANSRALPDRPFRLERLRAMDADVTLTAISIRREGLPLDNLRSHIILNDGILKLAPLNFGVAGGQVSSDIVLNGQNAKPTFKVDTTFNKLKLNQLFPGVELNKTSVGTISGSAALTGEGNSFAKLLASADGEVAAAMTGGKISNLLLEMVGIDGGEIIKYLLGGDRNATLRCAVADFEVNNGVMKTKVFVVDTTDTNIGGEGAINLQNETLNLTLVPLPKDKSILSLRSPLHVTGTFKDPDFTPDRKALVARGSATILLGALVNPLVALIPLIETGPGKDSDCQDLIQSASIARHKERNLKRAEVSR